MPCWLVLFQGFRCGYVVFGDSQHLDNAIKDKHKTTVVLSTDARPIATGMAKWCAEYRQRWPDPALLHRQTSQYIATYEKRVAEQKAELAQKANEPDEDGWVTVTRGSKKSVATSTLGKKTQLTPKEKRKLKKQQKEKVRVCLVPTSIGI